MGISSCTKKSSKAELSENQSPTPPTDQIDPIPIPDLFPVKDIYSYALGTANLGNTCFANSVHKLMWTYFRDQFPTPNRTYTTRFQDLFFDFMDVMQTQYKAIVEDPISASRRKLQSTFFKATLTEIFDEFEEELEVHTGSKSFGKLKIRRDQIDAQEYFSKLSEFLNLSELMSTFHLSSQIVFNTSGHKNALVTEKDSDGDNANNIYHFLSIAPSNTNLAEVLKFNETEEFTTANGNPRQKDNGSTDVEDAIGHNYYTLESGKTPPNKIILGIKRFSFDAKSKKSSKITQKIDATKEVQLSFHSLDLKTETKKTYQLSSVIVHKGTIDSGHYVAYTNDGEKWFLHDDKKVNLLNGQELTDMANEVALNGYIFLYEAVKP